MKKPLRKPVHVNEMLQGDPMSAALDVEAQALGAESSTKYIAKKLFELSQAKKVVTASFQGSITVKETDYAEANIQLDATREIARLANKYPKAQIDVNHAMTEQTARIMRDIVDGISRGKLPCELAEEEANE